MRSSSSPRRRTTYAVLTVLTIAAGVVLRRVHLGLPFWLVKYGGSALWAVMVYWVFAALKPAWDPEVLGVVSALFAAMVEFFKLYDAHALDAFRRTLAGTLLLGRYFSWRDIAVYWVAIALIAALDLALVRRAAR